MQVEYKVGDILLGELPYLKECEVEEIAIKAQCIKIDGDWYQAADITTRVKAVLGKVVYRKKWFSTERIVQYL